MLTTRRLFQAVLLMGLFALAARNVTDGDFWWHLRTGEYVLQTLTIPHQDIFSYTRAGQEWVAHEWLSQVIIAAIFEVGGFGALIITFAATIAVAFFLGFRRCVGNSYVAGFLTVVGALATAVLWDVRPQVIALLMTSIFLWVLDRYRRDETTRIVWLLVPLMLLWVNLHGSFLLGPAVTALYLLGGFVERHWMGTLESSPTRRGILRLALILVLMILVVPLNPNGVRMYSYPLETVTDPIIQSQINEWQSPDFHRLELQPLAWFIMGTLTALAFARRRPSFTRFLLVAVTLFEALRSVRLIPLFVLSAVPIVSDAVPIEATSTALRVRGLRVLNWALLGAILLASTVYAATVIRNQPDSERAFFPVAAVDFIQKEGLTGRMFNRYEWGGYLVWRLYPQQRVFIDGRADVYGALIEDYLATYRAAPTWRAILEKYDVEWVLIPPQAALAALLEGDGKWREVFQDPHAVIFLRKAEAKAAQVP
jgi:hypothetical protein